MKKSGQTLVVLLVFMAVAISVTTATVILVLSNSQVASEFQRGTSALTIAEGGAENALIRLLRDPDYQGETNLSIGQGLATATVSGNLTDKIIISEGNLGTFRRTVEVRVNFVNNIMTVTSWKEKF